MQRKEMPQKDCLVCERPYQQFNLHQRYCSDRCSKKAAIDRSGRISTLDLPPATVGTVAELIVSGDLLKKGYAVFRALSASCFCDVIAIKEKAFLRVEIRTGYMSDKGTILFSTNTH